MPCQRENDKFYPLLTAANSHLEIPFASNTLVCIPIVTLPGVTILTTYVEKLAKKINIMVKLKHHVSKATLLISLCYSLIYPYLTYACTLWGNNYNAPLSQIVKLQNNAVHVINDVS